MTQGDFQYILQLVELGGSPTFSVEADGARYTRRFAPEERLILLGGGHVAQPLCAMASMLNFAVTVVDDRALFANRERFPSAREIVCNGYTEAIEALKVTGRDYACVITRGHKWDGECLRALLSGEEPSYLGMIGSHRRVEGLLSVLLEEGFDPDALSRIHAPIGLSIGAVTPAEIAVSICAQLVGHRRAQTERDRSELEQTNTDLSVLRFLALSAEPKALALVLESDGSTPVKSGAMMAVDRLGRGYGTIGGGCGEAAVMARARTLIGTGKSFVAQIDMTNDAAAAEGLVCGGTMRVLIEDIR